MNHGKRSSYVRGCRCDDCRRANSAYTLKQQNDRAERQPPPESHGRASTYTNWRCRCKPCEVAYKLIKGRYRGAA